MPRHDQWTSITFSETPLCNNIVLPNTHMLSTQQRTIVYSCELPIRHNNFFTFDFLVNKYFRYYVTIKSTERLNDNVLYIYVQENPDIRLDLLKICNNMYSLVYVNTSIDKYHVIQRGDVANSSIFITDSMFKLPYNNIGQNDLQELLTFLKVTNVDIPFW